jgi:hypothetical protein
MALGEARRAVTELRPDAPCPVVIDQDLREF